MNLRNYQKEIARKGLRILNEKGIVYLAMETRTGKTITALKIAQDTGKRRVLFVTKKKAIRGIESDCKHFPELLVQVINYESVHKINDSFDIAIIDEAHSLGQYPRPSKRYRDLKAITFNLPCILLSATPSPESFSQLYHQFTINKFHPWTRYQNFYKWGYDFVNKKIKHLYNREVNDYSEAKKDLVDRDTRCYFLSFTQAQAGIKHRIDEKVLYCDMRPQTDKVIQKLNSDKIFCFPKGGEILADTPVKLMNKVQQLSSGTVKDEEGRRYITDYSKAYFIREQFFGKKIAIFYKFIAEFELLKKVFPDHTTSPEDFQSNNNLIFLAQFQSGREGIRLDTADAIIFYNIDFAFLSYEQAKNRIVSTERTTPAQLYWIFNRGGIEEKIYRVVKSKSNYTVHHYINDYVRERHSAKNYQRSR